MIILEILGLAVLIVALLMGALIGLQFLVFLAMRNQFGPEEGEKLFEKFSKALSDTPKIEP